MANGNGQAASQERIDPETGEELPREAEEGDELLSQIAEATTERARRITPLTIEEIRKRRETGPGMPVGIMGWFVRVGESTAKGKKIPGSRIAGQIVDSLIMRGKFGAQPAIVIFGEYSCPAYVNTQGQSVPAVAGKVGRWMVGVDSTLAALPGQMGAIVAIEFQRKGGQGQRHTYGLVNCWPVE